MSAIEWTEATWNPTTGCDRVSPGCDNCYALTMAARLKAMGQAKYQNDGDPRTSGPGFGLTIHPDALDIPLRRRKPTVWFVDSMSDLFHREVPSDFIAEVWQRMAITQRHQYQVLTKRPQRMAALLGSDEFTDAYIDVMVRTGQANSRWPLPNVWLGTSIESDRYTFRADHLRSTPAAVRFLSLEPLLGPLPSLDLTGIDWVIVGGESGPGARPMHPDWARDIRDRCVDAGVPFFFKQWGEWAPGSSTEHWRVALWPDGGPGITFPPREYARPSEATLLQRLGKKAAGRELDGRTWDQMPEVVTRCHG